MTFMAANTLDKPPTSPADAAPLDSGKVRRAVVHLLELAVAFENRGSVRVCEIDPETITSLPAAAPAPLPDDPEALACLVEVVERLEKHLRHQHSEVRKIWLKNAVEALDPVYAETIKREVRKPASGDRDTPGRPDGTLHPSRLPQSTITVSEAALGRVGEALRDGGFDPTDQDVKNCTPRPGFVQEYDGPKSAAAEVVGAIAGRSVKSAFNYIKAAGEQSYFRTQWSQVVFEPAVRSYVQDLLRDVAAQRAGAGKRPSLRALAEDPNELLPCTDNVAEEMAAESFRAGLRWVLLGERPEGADPRDTFPNVPDAEIASRLAEFESIAAQVAEYVQDPRYRELASKRIEEMVAKDFPSAARTVVRR
jgi:hypothetical protein